MGKINVLDFQVANLIAAGEVVERPASAVKELLENAIDAEATEITVEIKKGGTTFIRVSDNGTGMSSEDMPIAIRRHATSKIREAKDLDGIITLGFRGEALAAISSVSYMRIMSRREEDALGTMLTAQNGNLVDISEVGCKKGTTVIVEELFANVPARRKFLKKDQSEAMAVSAIVEKIALSRPDISVKLIIDGNIKFQTVGDGKIMSAVYAVLGREYANKMIEVDSMSEGVEVRGYIGRPDNVRSNRNFQNFFLNGRYVRSKTATAALEQAFESYMETEKFPSCVLYIYVHPAFVDVNVHPTKLEVKFSNERVVFDAIFCAVRNALMQATDKPQVMFEPDNMTAEQHSIYNAFVPVYDRIADSEPKKLSQQQIFDNMTDTSESQRPVDEDTRSFKSADDYLDIIPTPDDSDAPPQKSDKPEQTVNFYDLYADTTTQVTASSADGIEYSIQDKEVTEKTDEPLHSVDIAVTQTTETNEKFMFSLGQFDTNNVAQVKNYRILGTAFQTYIIVEVDEKVTIIDKHAAHERILFEKMKSIMHSQVKSSQTLLLPIEVKLTPTECDALDNYKEPVHDIGFDYGIVDGTLTLTAIPSILDEERAISMLETLASRLCDGTGDIATTAESFFEQALYQASCKAAVKAGRVDGEENMKWIVDVLMSNPSIICCPHGRPVAIELTKHEIEHLFKRI